MRLMIPLAVCCAAVCSSSVAMQFMGGMDGLGNFFDKLTGEMSGDPAEGKLCNMICGDCTQERFDELHVEMPEQSASNWKAICTGNKSEYVGNNEQWKQMRNKVGTNCCG